MPNKYEPVPPVGRTVDENGNVVFTPEEWAVFVRWLDGLLSYIVENYD